MEHSTDTAGWTDNLFALCDLVGIVFAPRLRDIGDQKLYRLDSVDLYPNAGRLLTGRIDTNLIVSQWDDLLRVGASLDRGWVSASLLLERWQARPRQNPLTRALQEYGRLQRTMFLLRYLAAPEYRREINRQLNRTESFHVLRRRIFFGQHGHVRRPHLDEQTDQAHALNLVVAAITCWNTLYIAAAINSCAKRAWRSATTSSPTSHRPSGSTSTLTAPTDSTSDPPMASDHSEHHALSARFWPVATATPLRSRSRWSLRQRRWL